MNYSEFLFNSLLSEHNQSFNELPYDLKFGAHQEYYQKFLNSDFNVDTKSEHDCMVEFIKNYNIETISFPEQNIVEKLFEDFDGNYFETGMDDGKLVVYNITADDMKNVIKESYNCGIVEIKEHIINEFGISNDLDNAIISQLL